MSWLSKTDSALSLREKLMLAVTAMLLVVIGVIAFTAVRDERGELRKQYLGRGLAITRIVEANIGEDLARGDQAAVQEGVERLVVTEPTLLRAKVYVIERGTLFVWASSEPAQVGASAEGEHGDAVTRGKAILQEERDENPPVLESFVSMGQDHRGDGKAGNAWLGLYFSLEPLDSAISSLRNRFLTVGGIGVGVLVAAIFIIIRQIVLMRIRTLAAAIRRVTAGDLTVRIPGPQEQQTRDELVVLTQGFNDMVESIQSLYDETQRLSITDPLTGVYNRRYLDEALDNEAKRARRLGYPFAVAMVDIDRFKRINDEFGHTEGDLVLRQVAGVLSMAIRETDTVARYGGEEFIIIYPGCDVASAYGVADKLRQTIEVAFADAPSDRGGGTTVSVGIAVYGDAPETVEELVRRADEAMYQAKLAGRNCSMLAGAANLPV